jgi:hypothetical protein
MRERPARSEAPILAPNGAKFEGAKDSTKSTPAGVRPGNIATMPLGGGFIEET